MFNAENFNFEKRNQSDDVTQFWCEELKMSIFIDKNHGIVAAGVESIGTVVWKRVNIEKDNG